MRLFTLGAIIFAVGLLMFVVGVLMILRQTAVAQQTDLLILPPTHIHHHVQVIEPTSVVHPTLGPDEHTSVVDPTLGPSQRTSAVHPMLGPDLPYCFDHFTVSQHHTYDQLSPVEQAWVTRQHARVSTEDFNGIPEYQCRRQMLILDEVRDYPSQQRLARLQRIGQ